MLLTALVGIAKACGLNPIMPASTSILTEVFPFLQASKSSSKHPGNSFPKFREHKTNAFDLRAFSLNFEKHIELIGRFQSWRYFDHIRSDVRAQFSFSRRAVSLVQNFLHNASASARRQANSENQFGDDLERFPVTFIAMHVRRKDVVTAAMREEGYRAADVNYLDAAMHYFRHKFKNVVFVIASDDVTWCRHNLNSRRNIVVYSPFTHPGLDMCLLTQCNHTVTTTGAFSWWAGFLSGGTVTYFASHPQPGSPLARQLKPLDYFLSTWVPITS